MDSDSRKKSKKEQLRKKLNRKKVASGETPLPDVPDMDKLLNDDSILNMINQVNIALRENPSMIKKIGKCINNVFDNKDLMSSLINEVQTNIINHEETLDSSPEKDSLDASGNDSKQ